MVSSGALTQLSAKSAQDAHLTAEPQHSFFKGVVRRHTNFALAEIPQTFAGQVGYGKKKMSCTFDRSGDLLAQVYLYMAVPAITYAPNIYNPPVDAAYYTNSFGHALIEECRIEIGGHEFDTQNGEIMEIDEELTHGPGKRLSEMIGFYPTTQELIVAALREQYMYVPFRFWFNKNYEQNLPLIALQYHEVKLTMNTNPIDQLVVRQGQAVNPANAIVAPQPDEMALLANYVFLDTQERRLFARQSHQYLIEQIQFTGSESHSAGTTTQNLKLLFNHPVKELLWVAQRDAAVAANQAFDFSGVQDFTGLPTDPIVTGQLFLNGHDRTIEHPSVYYRTVQPWQHHTNIPKLPKYLYGYSFALFPESLQPSGSCNMSRIDNVVLRLTFPDVASGLSWDGQVRVYARNFNSMKIVSGMAGLMYAN